MRRLRHELGTEGRARSTDLVADLAERALGPMVGWPVPRAALRRGVGRGSSREEYLKAGALAVAELLGFLSRSDRTFGREARILDFGCGAGRLAGILLAARVSDSLVGVDVDEAAVRWCQRHLRQGRFLSIAPRPPMPLAGGSFELAFAASVFTHFDEQQQFEWLEELARVLTPGGLLLASTHAPTLLGLRPEIGAEGCREMERKGFLYEPGRRGFNEGAAFHAHAYLERHWSRWFRLIRIEPAALFALQDLSLWERAQ